MLAVFTYFGIVTPTILKARLDISLFSVTKKKPTVGNGQGEEYSTLNTERLEEEDATEQGNRQEVK